MQNTGSLKIALDELRMQMLGAQVAFGFQFQSLFQERVNPADAATRVATSAGMALILLTLAFLIAGPAVAPLMLGIAMELYVATSRLFDSSSIAGGSAALAVCALGGFWFVLPVCLRRVGCRRQTPRGALDIKVVKQDK